MTDLGKPTIDLLNATRAIIERDIGQGFITPDRLRFTIEARKEEVKKLANAGMSQRQIAKATGVSKETVARDLGKRDAAQNVPTNGTERASPPNLKPLFLMRAEQAQGFAEACRQIVTEMDGEISPEFASAASAAAEAWTTLAHELGDE